MRTFCNSIEVPYLTIPEVPHLQQLIGDIEKLDLLSPATLTTEKVFLNTHRLVASNPIAEKFMPARQRYVPGDRSDYLAEILKPQLTWLQQLYPTSKPLVIQCATLPPGKSLLWHMDTYQYQSVSHKVHIPIITNPAAFYEHNDGSGPVKSSFVVGKAYEINNILMHRATNAGSKPRTHVIIDMLENEGFRLLEEGVDILFTHHAANKLAEENWK